MYWSFLRCLCILHWLKMGSRLKRDCLPVKLEKSRPSDCIVKLIASDLHHLLFDTYWRTPDSTVNDHGILYGSGASAAKPRHRYIDRDSICRNSEDKYRGGMIPSVPFIFGGTRENWEDWIWNMRLYLELHCPTGLSIISSVKDSDLPLDFCSLKSTSEELQVTEDCVDFSRRLHYLLCETTVGVAQVVVKMSSRGDGIEAWKMLHRHFSTPSRPRGIRTLSHILQ